MDYQRPQEDKDAGQTVRLDSRHTQKRINTRHQVKIALIDRFDEDCIRREVLSFYER